MAIDITTDTITIDNEILNFEDIYQYSKSINSNMVQKLSNTYLIAGNLILQNNTYLSDTDVSVTITGQLLQIKKTATLQLGKYIAGRGRRGCILNAPYILKEYGFGSIIPEESGNLLAYESLINIYGYWSFFSGDNHVELIDCIIDGYGKISGINSIIRDTTFKRAHGKYGTIIYIGNIKEYINITIDTVEPYIENEDISFSNILTIDKDSTSESLDIYYGEYSGYSNLLQILDTLYSYDINLYGTKVNDGYNISRTDINKNNFYHRFKFNPRFQDENGMILPNIRVVIKNKLGEIEFDGTTDVNGYIDTWLTYYRDLAGPSEGEVITPHKVEIILSNYTLTSVIYINRNMEKFPVLLYNGDNLSTSDNVLITQIVNDAQVNILTDVKIELDNINSSLRQVMLGIGSDIREIPTVINKSNGQKLFL